MIDRYLSRFVEESRTAIAGRTGAAGPRVLGLAVTMCALVALFIAVSILAGPLSGAVEFHFVEERGAVTVLSAIFLAMGAGFAFVAFLLSSDGPKKTRIFWFLATMAVGFLAMDELLEFHEKIGRRLDRVDFLFVTSGDLIRGWNDVIVVLYGVVALPVALLFLPTVLRHPKLLQLMCVAAGFYTIHTAIDSLTEPPTSVSIILEESAKLYCSAFVALALLTAVLYIARKGHELEASSDDPPPREPVRVSARAAGA